MYYGVQMFAFYNDGDLNKKNSLAMKNLHNVK